MCHASLLYYQAWMSSMDLASNLVFFECHWGENWPRSPMRPQARWCCMMTWFHLRRWGHLHLRLTRSWYRHKLYALSTAHIAVLPLIAQFPLFPLHQATNIWQYLMQKLFCILSASSSIACIQHSANPFSCKSSFCFGYTGLRMGSLCSALLSQPCREPLALSVKIESDLAGSWWAELL